MNSLLKGDNSTRRYGGLNNKRERLLKGNDHVIKGTIYIQIKDFPKHRKVTYGIFM